MLAFAIQAPPRILFGRGEAARAAGLVRRLGDRIVVAHGANAVRAAWLIDTLTAEGADVLPLGCRGEPLLSELEAGLEAARRFGATAVVGLGGGAAIDFGKALAALIPSQSAPMDHLEVIGRGEPLGADPLPYVAIPTTAGTGAEVTKNAVIASPEHGRKVSLRDDRMIPRVAIVDPALTDDCPRAITLASGLDAVVQVIEPYVSSKATPFTDAIARPAIGRGLLALARLMADGDRSTDAAAADPTARDEMAWVSLCGGLSLANAGLGAVHGLAGVIGGLVPAPHGLICGRLIGPVLRANRAKADGLSAHRLDEVFAEITHVLGGPADAAPETLTAWITAQGLAPIGRYGLGPDRFAAAAAAAQTSSSMRGNPVPLAAEELEAILVREAAA